MADNYENLFQIIVFKKVRKLFKKHKSDEYLFTVLQGGRGIKVNNYHIMQYCASQIHP